MNAPKVIPPPRPGKGFDKIKSLGQYLFYFFV